MHPFAFYSVLLEKRGYRLSQGYVQISEEELYKVLQACKHEAFCLIVGGMFRELKEELDRIYWADVEAEEIAEMERFLDEECFDEECFGLE